MQVTIITDCQDSNAFGRQLTRASSLFNCPVFPVSVNLDIEAAGNLIDTLDAIEDREGVVIVNVAPRNGEGKKWENGTPFGYFKYRNVSVITTIAGKTLSLIKKLKLVKSIQLLDIPQVVKFAGEKGIMVEGDGERIIRTQFRSYEFASKAVYWIYSKEKIPSKELSLETIDDKCRKVWWIDNFGNCKTTILKEELNVRNNRVRTSIGNLQYFSRLKDVPDGETAIINGSSGIGENRFVEIVVQGGSAKDDLKLSTGDLIL